MYHFDVNISKFWRKNMKSICKFSETHFFHINFQCKKRVLITSKWTQNAPFWCNFWKNFRGRPPGPPPAGGGDPLPHPSPFGASRLSEAFGFIGHLCPPRQWRFWIRPWEDVTWVLHLIKFRQIPVRGCREEVGNSNISVNQRPGTWMSSLSTDPPPPPKKKKKK